MAGIVYTQREQRHGEEEMRSAFLQARVQDLAVPGGAAAVRVHRHRADRCVAQRGGGQRSARLLPRTPADGARRRAAAVVQPAAARHPADVHPVHAREPDRAAARAARRLVGDHVRERRAMAGGAVGDRSRALRPGCRTDEAAGAAARNRRVRHLRVAVPVGVGSLARLQACGRRSPGAGLSALAASSRRLPSRCSVSPGVTRWDSSPFRINRN